ncbi:HK97 gp10 family phage protein [Xenorhabdus sp. ZM]|uniref:HK97 gp10 family phage protein n=1 Tax=Xenorhabdus szentirmaii TaxID=290112 RepID=UPI0019930BA6|nr:HK97 gp10 family phage protein [Xenorhabdus sp. ZM]MBD2806357.1 HK97 gp10 family phage protein [Xenorhabdus sp. ZM]
MGVKVKGIKEAQTRLNALIGDIKGRKVVRAMYKALSIGSTQAALYTPIDTATLINSQFRDIRFDGVLLTGRVGYSANYAVYVHDPKVKQAFRRASAKKEFLKRGFNEMRGEIDKAVAPELTL